MPKARRDTTERCDEVIAAPAVRLVSGVGMPDFNSNAVSAQELPLFPLMVFIRKVLRFCSKCIYVYPIGGQFKMKMGWYICLLFRKWN